MPKKKQQQQRRPPSPAAQAPGVEHHALCLDGVLENVMRYLDQQHWLGSCSLVCTRWRAAALAVAAEVGLLLSPAEPLSEAWLARHGVGLQALVVRGGSLCGQGDTHSVALLQQLTRLELSSVTSQPVLLRAIGDSMQELLHLGLVNLDWGPLFSTSSREELSSATDRLWQGCTKLTYLQAEQCDLNDDNVTSLCKNLRHLSSLDLSGNVLCDQRSLGELPPSLTSLCLGGNIFLDFTHILRGSSSGGVTAAAPAEGIAGTSSSSGSSCLPSLQALDINGATLQQPQVLAELTALTWLNVDYAAMPHPSDLLAVLPKLLQLQQLNMTGCIGDHRPAVPVAALRAALQPLTRLTALDIGSNAFEQAPEQQGEGHAPVRSRPSGLFAGLLLPQLQVLGASKMSMQDVHDDGIFLSRDLVDLAAACPALRWLRLQLQRSLALQSSSALQPLTALSHSLTRLDLDAGARDEPLRNAHLQALAQLTSLRHLDVSGVGSSISDRGLYRLTALTGLTLLRLADISSQLVSSEVLPTKTRKERYGGPGDVLLLTAKFNKNDYETASVAQQLKQQCAKSPQLWKEVQQDLVEELKTAKKATKDAQREATSERHRAAAAQKLARKAETRAQAAQDEVAALRQQLEALQAQLQQSQSQLQ